MNQDRPGSKRAIQRLLQRTLGLPVYLDLFARYRWLASRWDSRDAAFRAFLGQLPEDGLVLDVGANVGVTAVHLARRVRRGTIHAFEPNPFTRAAAERLARRLRARNVVFHACAVGSRASEVEMIMPARGQLLLHGLSRVSRGVAPSAEGRRFRVNGQTLDGMDEWFGPGARVTGMKLDVEDSESEVILGARRLLASHRPLVYCELWLTPNRDRAADSMRELGYRVLVHRRGRLEPFDPPRHASDQDFFFVPETSA